MKTTELYLIIENWHEMPEELFEDKQIAERIAQEKFNVWQDLMYKKFSNITSSDIQDCMKLSTTVNKFDVITLYDCIIYHNNPTRALEESKRNKTETESV
jgi:hypothetical protein